MTQERVKPLFEDALASDELREFAALARADGPSRADLDRLAFGLSAQLGGAAGIVAPDAITLGSAPADLQRASHLPPAPRAWWWRKLMSSNPARILAVIGLSAGIGAGAWRYARPAAHAPSPVASVASVAQAPLTTGIAKTAPGAPKGPTALEHRSGPTHLAELPTPAELARERVEAREPAEGARPQAGRTAQVAAERRRESTSRVRAGRRRGQAQAAQVRSAVEPAVSELELIEQAEAARSRSAEALSLLARHEQLYPHGALVQEREALTIELLARAGERARARARARDFEAAYPDSAHLPRVRALISRVERE